MDKLNNQAGHRALEGVEGELSCYIKLLSLHGILLLTLIVSSYLEPLAAEDNQAAPHLLEEEGELFCSVCSISVT